MHAAWLINDLFILHAFYTSICACYSSCSAWFYPDRRPLRDCLHWNYFSICSFLLLLFNLFSLLDREYECIGGWEEDDLIYTYTRRFTVFHYTPFRSLFSTQCFIVLVVHHSVSNLTDCHFNLKFTDTNAVCTFFFMNSNI